MSEWFEGDVNLGGLSIHYYRTGQGEKPPLVLSHGFTDNGLCWTRVAKVLEQHFDIIMVDARNHGGSGRALASGEANVNDLAGVIKALGLNQPTLLGHSVGAATVAHLAASYPNLVSRIILEDPPWSADQSSENDEGKQRRLEGFRKYVQSLATLSDAQIIDNGKAQHPDWHNDDFPAWAASKRKVSEDAMNGLSMGNWIDSINKIKCPALLIYADDGRDGIVKQSVVDKVTTMNSQFKAQEVAGAGHNIRREQFDRYMKAVTAYLLD